MKIKPRKRKKKHLKLNLFGVLSKTLQIVTPNQLYKDVKELPNATVIKDAGSKTDFEFEEFLQNRIEENE